MIDYGVFLLCVLLLGLAGRRLWYVLAGPPGSRMASVGRAAVCLVLALLGGGYGIFRFTKARSVQLFGSMVQRVSTADSVVALTFDDGPMPGATEAVLRILDEEGARATFFLNGSAVEVHPGDARRIVTAGHEVGNHSYEHRVMMGISLGEISSEVERTDAQIRSVGYRGPIHFRSPYGKRFVALPWYLWRTGRTNVLFDVEPETFADVDGDAERITRHVLERVRPGSIILLHVMFRSRAESLRAVPGVVRGLRERGYRLVTVSELLRYDRSRP